MIKTKILTILSVISIFSSTAWSMEDNLDLKEGIIYKIKNKESQNVLDSHTGIAGMYKEHHDQKKYFSRQLWQIIKKGNYFKIKNINTGTVLNSVGKNTGKNSVTLEEDVDDKNQCASHRLWYLKKNNDYYKIKNFYSGNCLKSFGKETSGGSAAMEVELEEKVQGANLLLWTFIPVYKKIDN